MPVLTTSGLVLLKAGKKVDIAFRNISGSDQLIQIISGAEAFYSNVARYDFINNYSSLNQRTREILSEGVSSRAATQLIAYDMGQYTSRVEAESMINLHTTIDKDCQLQIKEKQKTDFMLRGSSQ